MPEDVQVELLQTHAQAPVEALLLSTCNRVELYLAGATDGAAPDAARQSLARAAGHDLDGHLYLHRGEAALHHLFRVSASLDSMVLGEPQILGQVKDAFELAQRSRRRPRRADPGLRRGLRERQAGPDRDRRSAGPPPRWPPPRWRWPGTSSPGSRGRRCSWSGQGRWASWPGGTWSLPARPGSWCANRTFERAEAVAKALGGQAVPFEPMEENLVLADVVVCSTASPAAGHHPGPGGSGAEAASPPAALPGGPGGAARRRALGALAGRRLRLRRGRHPEGGERERGVPRRGGGPGARRWWPRRWPASSASGRCDDQVPVLAQLRARAEQIRKAELERALAQPAQPRSPRSRPGWWRR